MGLYALFLIGPLAAVPFLFAAAYLAWRPLASFRSVLARSVVIAELVGLAWVWCIRSFAYLGDPAEPVHRLRLLNQLGRIAIAAGALALIGSAATVLAWLLSLPLRSAKRPPRQTPS
jgi:hypothetical protein